MDLFPARADLMTMLPSMVPQQTFWPDARRQARSVAGIALAVVAVWWAPPPSASTPERAHRAAAFHFERQSLATPPDGVPKAIRAVHPSLAHIAAWISAVGASVALNDLDGDGVANDACHVDPRYDEVVVSSLHRPARFAAFALPLRDLPYDARSMAPMGCLPGDFNEDGRIDLLVYFWGRTPMLFLRGDALLHRPWYVAHELDSSGDRWFTNAATTADIDGDGHADLVIANYFQDGGRILDAEADPDGPAQVMQHSMTRASNGGGTHVFLWSRVDAIGEPAHVHYRQVDPGLSLEIAQRWTLALGAADLDGDLLPELYFANDFGPDVLLHNGSSPGHVRLAPVFGRRTFRMPASKVLGRDSFKGMGVDFGDINADGTSDIFVSNIAAPFALEESHFLFLSRPASTRAGRRFPEYVDASEDLGVSRSGWGWDAKLDDFDNDGVLEAVQATGFVRGVRSKWPELQELATANDQLLHDPRYWPPFLAGDDLSGDSTPAFFARHGDGRYYDVARGVGLGERQVSRGLAIADVDADGRLDLAIANQWEPSFLYMNRSPRVGYFVGLHLGRPLDADAPFDIYAGHPRPHRRATPAIGAAVEIWRGGRRLGSRQVDGGNGHSGRRSSDLHFGIGDDPTPVRVIVRWRDRLGGIRVRSLDVEPGWHTLTLGER